MGVVTGRDRPFALALGIWLLAGLVFWLSSARFTEVLPNPIFAMMAMVAFLVIPLALIGWAVVRALRKRGSWLAGPAVIVAAITLVAAGIPLYPASIYLNFWSHRPQYDAVVADMKAGRLESGGEARWVEGRRHGVNYGYAAGIPGVIIFPWQEVGFHGPMGVVFDEKECPYKPAPPAALIDVRPGQPPGITNAGRHDHRQHLDGFYCFSIPRG